MKNFIFDNSYRKLSASFYSDVLPEIPINPKLLVWNQKLADQLEIGLTLEHEEQICALFSGSEIPEGCKPLSMAYAGHQFGNFTMLGDGRAVLLGERITSKKNRFDVQLKGSGRTPFSRGGDGLATTRAMLKEYLISECMYALGIPTSRSLSVVQTGKNVLRETPNPGAILTRIMDSHLRVGTFEYARHFLSTEEQKELLKYAIWRHFPSLSDCENPALLFLKNVADKQRELIIQWMRVGFIHGVMNTDNMHIGGQTFDYGPCAFMNAYNPKTVFSSIDRNGRYAYANQAEIALWNLSVLAGALLPQIDENEDIAVELAKNVLNEFASQYRNDWSALMCKKIGFHTPSLQAKLLVERLLSWMQLNQADYTNTFLVLSEDVPIDSIPVNDGFKIWLSDWKELLAKETNFKDAHDTMKQINPKVIPRNDKVEAALDAASNQSDFTLLQELIEVMTDHNHPKVKKHQFFDANFDRSFQTFCGT